MNASVPDKPETEPSANGNPMMGLWQRVGGVLWGCPQKAFEDIASAPKPTGIIVLFLILNLALVVPILPKIKEYTLWTLQNAPAAAQMPAVNPDTAVTLAMAARLIGAVAGPLLIWLVMAALLKLFNSFNGEKTSFKSLFTIAAYSCLPVMLATIIWTILVMTTPGENMAKVSTSLALILPADRMDRLYVILSQIDPFYIWSLALLAIGSSVAMKTTVKKTSVYIGALWLIYVLAVGLLSPVNQMAI